MCSPGFNGTDCSTEMYHIPFIFCKDGEEILTLNGEGEGVIYHDKFNDGEG